MKLCSLLSDRDASRLRTKFVLFALTLVLASCGGSSSDQPQDAKPAKLSIESQPADRTVVEGEPATFSVAAVGSDTLSYQWRHNDVPLPGADAQSYTLPAATSADDGSTFSVLVSDGQTTIASAAARLRVTSKPVAPSIVVPPADQRAVEGASVSFSVTAEGSAPLAFAWQRNGVVIPGAASSTLTLKAVPADHGSTFSVVVSNTNGSVTSAQAVLSIDAAPTAPTIVAQPSGAAVIAPEPATFSATATGTAPLSYQWRRNGVAIAGASAPTYTTPATTVADNNSVFTLVVSNVTGSVTTHAAALTVNVLPTSPTITAQPADQTVTQGQTASFSAAASGTAPLTYQWRRNGANIVGANASTYTTPPTTSANHGSVYTLRVSNAAGSATSNAATLTVNVLPTPPAITAQPADQSVTQGQAATFSVAASGTAPLSYQWRRNGTDIVGANASTYATASTTTTDSGSAFSVVVSNAAGSATSNAATLTVNALPIAPAITTEPTDQSVAQGQTASFSVAATGTAPLSYQWRSNGSNITGANASTYNTPATTAGTDNGAQYDVVVSNGAGSATSRKATLTVTVPTSYLASLLASIPEGGWVKANTNSFSDAWPTGPDLPPPTPSGPYAIIRAWSGFAWDTRRSQLILWGGGHANYVGNEVYVWRGSDGRWTRGSLPSRVDLSTAAVMGNGGPQSAHTYQTNSYAPLVDRFVVFGGAAWNSGGPLGDANGRTGAWWWDPSKADPGRVGGQDGTGWDPIDLGSYAWQMRPDFPWVGLPGGQGPSFIYGTSAYREENGQDVIYLTMDMQTSGWPSLYRYQLGSPTTPDLFQRVGTPSGMSIMQSGAADIDTRRGLFVRTARAASFAPGDLAVWRLANNNPANPALNRDFAVQLVEENGTAIDMNFASSIAYDSTNDRFVIWDGRDRGTVWITQTTINADGSIAPVWVVRRAPSTTAAQPMGNHSDGVLGKWKYVTDLKAFVALDAYTTSQRGDVWLYKPPSP